VIGAPTKIEADLIVDIATTRPILVKRKAGIEVDMRIAITTKTATTEEKISTTRTRRVIGDPTKKEADRIANIATTRPRSSPMKNVDGSAETKRTPEDVVPTKTKMKNDIESATNMTSGRRATLANEETTTAAIKNAIVAVEVKARL
jgi:hypothetical protein